MSVSQVSNYGDRLYTIDTYEIMPSAARTVTTNSATYTAINGDRFMASGIQLFINVTALAGAPSVTPFLQGFEGVTFYDLLQADAITATGMTVLRLFPGAAQNPKITANDHLPDIWRVAMSHANANSITYTVTAKLFL